MRRTVTSGDDTRTVREKKWDGVDVKRRKPVVALVCIAVLAFFALGCNSLFQSDKDPEEKTRPVPASSGAPAATTSQAEGNYRLTFTGTEPAPSDFAAPNRTPANLTDTTFSAEEIVNYTFGPEQVPIAARDTWRIEAEHARGVLTGTVLRERWHDEVTETLVTDTDTGQQHISSDYYEPALTLWWKGELVGTVADDGTIEGTVEGTWSNSEGLSRPFAWTFTGTPVK